MRLIDADLLKENILRWLKPSKPDEPEMIEVANILQNASSNSFIILDEIGRGTSTYDGMSIAFAVIKYIEDQIKAKTEPESPEPRLLTDESHDGVMTNHDGVMQEEIRSEEKRVDKSKEGKKTVSQKLDFSGWPEIPSDDLIAEWMTLRSKQKAPVTQRVVNMFGKQLTIANKSGFTIEQCIEQCLCKGWRGFEAEWMANQKPSSKALSPQKTPRAFGE